MTSELDIYRAANLLIHLHGPNAELEAVQLTMLMHARGNHERLHLWMQIRRAIEKLKAQPSGTLH